MSQVNKPFTKEIIQNKNQSVMESSCATMSACQAQDKSNNKMQQFSASRENIPTNQPTEESENNNILIESTTDQVANRMSELPDYKEERGSAKDLALLAESGSNPKADRHLAVTASLDHTAQVRGCPREEECNNVKSTPVVNSVAMQHLQSETNKSKGEPEGVVGLDTSGASPRDQSTTMTCASQQAAEHVLEIDDMDQVILSNGQSTCQSIRMNEERNKQSIVVIMINCSQSM